MRKPIIHLLIFLFIAASLLGGCSATSAPAPQSESVAGESAAVGSPAQPVLDTSSITGIDAAQAAERIVIKNASLSIAVSDPGKSMDSISRMADEMGGFVVSANQYQSVTENGVMVPRASITIRVPAENLQEALERIKAETDRPVISQNIESQDVTSDYIDLKSRLRNLENTESQLSKIMEEARQTEDVLAVYNQLVQVREQIEVLQGQIKYYDESAALSSIKVELHANEAVVPLTIGSWQPQGVARSALQALINGLKVVANLLIWVVIFFLPIGLVLFLVFVLPAGLVLRAIRRRTTNRKPAVPPAPPAPTGSQ